MQMIPKNLNVGELFSAYKNWICKNPQTAGDLESAIKWISIIISGKLNTSHCMNELVFSASNILSLFNDLIICSTKKTFGAPGDKIKLWLTVIYHCEFLIELSAKKIWGETGRWIIVTYVQLFKCIARLTLLLHYKEKLTISPPIKPLNRFTEKAERGSDSVSATNNAFLLKRSGRVVRKIEAAPLLLNRTWKPPVMEFPHLSESMDKTHKMRHLLGEILFIVKPVISLGIIQRVGRKDWKLWYTSLLMDIISLYLLHPRRNLRKPEEFTREQLSELQKRKFSLLIYLLRSPFYDNYAVHMLSSMKPLPLVPKVLNKFLPLWEDSFHYMWAT